MAGLSILAALFGLPAGTIEAAGLALSTIAAIGAIILNEGA